MFELLAIDKTKNTTVVLDGVVAVVRDRHGNPLVLIQSLGPDQTTIVMADDPTFKTKLKQFGIDKTVIVDHYNVKHTMV